MKNLHNKNQFWTRVNRNSRANFLHSRSRMIFVSAPLQHFPDGVVLVMKGSTFKPGISKAKRTGQVPV